MIEELLISNFRIVIPLAVNVFILINHDQNFSVLFLNEKDLHTKLLSHSKSEKLKSAFESKRILAPVKIVQLVKIKKLDFNTARNYYLYRSIAASVT